mmetsp:Transcript_60127/g.127378  ORF Transcript_60127/g.127378 Transcript_60127/m.127378 type:complete len:213 (-) Transcript_60127:88-726(-)
MLPEFSQMPAFLAHVTTITPRSRTPELSFAYWQSNEVLLYHTLASSWLFTLIKTLSKLLNVSAMPSDLNWFTISWLSPSPTSSCLVSGSGEVRFLLSWKSAHCCSFSTRPLRLDTGTDKSASTPGAPSAGTNTASKAVKGVKNPLAKLPTGAQVPGQTFSEISCNVRRHSSANSKCSRTGARRRDTAATWESICGGGDSDSAGPLLLLWIIA